MANHRFFIVITEEGFPSKVTPADTVEEMKAIVRSLFAKKGPLSTLQVHVFHGEQWKITTGPTPYLLPPNHLHTGQSVPLFTTPHPGPVDEDGFLGIVDEEQDSGYAKVTKAAAKPKNDTTGSDPDGPFDS